MMGDLALSLANTLSSDRARGDLLMNVRDLRDWLARHDLTMNVASAAELKRFRDLRAVVRDLFTARAGHRPPAPQPLAPNNAGAAVPPHPPPPFCRPCAPPPPRANPA